MNPHHVQRWHARLPPDASRSTRVVVADDDHDLRSIIVVALRGAGYSPIAVQNGAELLDQMSDALLTGDPSLGPDLVIADVRMPGLTGLGILVGARQAGWSGPFVLMTAYPDPWLREEAEQCDAVFFAKPFEIDDLVTVAVNLAPPGKAPSIPPTSRRATSHAARQNAR